MAATIRQPRLLLTGSCGYIGEFLLPLLVGDFEVIGLDANLYGSGVLPILQTDLRDIDCYHLDSVDVVVHLAGLSHNPLADICDSLTHEINTFSSIHLASLALRSGVRRFVFLSSCSVYADGPEELKTEDSELSPQSAYARSKQLAEEGILSLQDEFFSPVILRPGTVLGVSPMMRLDLMPANLLMQAYLTGIISLHSSEKITRPVIHIVDVCAAIVAACKADKSELKFDMFNVGGNVSNFTQMEIARVAASITGCLIELTASPANDLRSYHVSFNRIASELPGFKQTKSLEGGMFEIWQWLQLKDRLLLNQEMFRYSRLDAIRLAQASGTLSHDLRSRSTQKA